MANFKVDASMDFLLHWDIEDKIYRKHDDW